MNERFGASAQVMLAAARTMYTAKLLTGGSHSISRKREAFCMAKTAVMAVSIGHTTLFSQRGYMRLAIVCPTPEEIKINGPMIVAKAHARIGITANMSNVRAEDRACPNSDTCIEALGILTTLLEPGC